MYSSRRFLRALFTSTAWWMGIAASLLLQLLTVRMIDDKANTQFDYLVGSAQHAIEHRVRSYIDILRGTTALFDISHRLTHEQFRSYVNALRLEQNFPGMRTLNFIQRIPLAEKSAFENAMKFDISAGVPDFSITPPGERAEYMVLSYIEPIESYPRLLGIDLAIDSRIAPTLAVSRDSGELSVSGIVRRLPDSNRVAVLTMHMPVYRHGMPQSTVEERRNAYLGSAGVSLDLDKLMLGAVNQETLKYVRIAVYDNGTNNELADANGVAPGNVLFDSRTAERNGLSVADGMEKFVKHIDMRVGQRVWQIHYTAPQQAMIGEFERYLPWLVLAAALAASTLLFAIYYSLASARRHAMELARDMTRDLRASEASLAKAQHMARLGSWILEFGTSKMVWSDETYRIFGVHRHPGDIAYEEFLLYIHPEDRQKVRDSLDQSISTGGESTLEHRIMHRDGSVRWVQTISRLGYGNQSMLLRGTIMDITERKNAVEALKRSQGMLRELTAHQDRVKEDERKRIAREIHDELGQTLLALRIDVSMLAARTEKNHPRLHKKVNLALQHLDATVKTIRTIINNLRPAVLDLGLNAAIEWQVAEFRRRTGIPCELKMEEQDLMVGDPRSTPLFRILQESLTNVMRHAQATHVTVELCKREQRLALKISDNGIGIQPREPSGPSSFGLVGMEERVHALNGKFHISSTPGHGTTLMILIPLEQDGMLEEQ